MLKIRLWPFDRLDIGRIDNGELMASSRSYKFWVIHEGRQRLEEWCFEAGETGWWMFPIVAGGGFCLGY